MKSKILVALAIIAAVGSLQSCKSNDEPELETNKINGHEYADLGLSVKWATCNVGATKPEEFGGFYAWGEINTKSEYTLENSLTDGIEMDDIAGNPKYDAATANWGGSWKMPNKDQMDELVDNCDWEWITLNGVDGYKITGPNGNSIFMPAAGYIEGSSQWRPDRGDYRISTPHGNQLSNAFQLNFSQWGYGVGHNWRYIGFSVRPVSN